jgi:hypothetical protein
MVADVGRPMSPANRAGEALVVRSRVTKSSRPEQELRVFRLGRALHDKMAGNVLGPLDRRVLDSVEFVVGERLA